MTFHNWEWSWRIFKWLEFTDWRWPPEAGALVDQPEWLMDDLRKIKWLVAIVREQQRSAFAKQPARTLGGS